MGINDIIEEALALKPSEKYLVMDTLMSSLVKVHSDLSHFEKEIEEGLESRLSTKTHKEIFQALQSKYA